MRGISNQHQFAVHKTSLWREPARHGSVLDFPSHVNQSFDAVHRYLVFLDVPFLLFFTSVVTVGVPALFTETFKPAQI